MPKVKTAVTQAVFVLALALLWQAGVWSGLLDPFYVSSPVRIAQRLLNLFSKGRIFADVWVTLAETAVGFATGAAVGSLTACLLYQSSRYRRVFSPMLSALNALPRVALTPLLILWFGIGMLSKVVLVFSLVFFIFLFGVLGALDHVDLALLRHASLLRANRRDLIWHVYVPTILEALSTSLRLGIAFGFMGAVVGEYIASSSGLGNMIQTAQNQFDTTGVMAGLVVAFVLVAVVDRCALIVERRVTPWRQEGQSPHM